MSQGTQVGSFIATNFIWELSQIGQLEDISPELKELLIRLYQNLGLMATVLNTKDTGIYQLTEFVNGQRFFSNPAYNSSTAVQPTPRQDYRMVINFGALPDSTTKSVAHNIAVNAGTTFTRIYGAATDPNTLGIPIPNVEATNPVQINVDPTNVNITTTTNMTAFTTEQRVEAEQDRLALLRITVGRDVQVSDAVPADHRCGQGVSERTEAERQTPRIDRCPARRPRRQGADDSGAEHQHAGTEYRQRYPPAEGPASQPAGPVGPSGSRQDRPVGSIRHGSI